MDELKIGIKLTADTAGGTKAEQSLAGVKRSGADLAKTFAESNAKGAEFGKTISSLNADQLLDVEQGLLADIKATKALGQSTEELQKKFRETFERRTGNGLSQSLNNTRDAANSAGNAIGGAGFKAEATGKLVRGLASATQEGATGWQGLGNAAHGAAQIFKGAFGIIAGGAAVLAVAKLGFDKLADVANTRLANAFKNVGVETERLKTKSKELEEQAAKDLEAQRARVDSLSKAYASLVAKQDQAAGRSKALGDADTSLAKAGLDKQEQQALAKAKTPAEKERISADFSQKRDSIDTVSKGRQIDSEDLQAKLKIRTAEEAQLRLREEIYSAEAELVRKQTAAENAKEIANQGAQDAAKFGSSDDAESRAARRAAAGSKVDFDLAQQEVEQAKARRGALEDEFGASSAQIDEGKQSLALNSRRRKQLKTEAETSGLKKLNDSAGSLSESKDRLKDLQTTARDAGSRGDNEAQDKAVAEIKKLDGEIKKKEEAQKKADAQTAENVSKVTETVQKTEPPQVASMKPVEAAFIEYGGKVYQVIAGQRVEIDGLAATVRTLSRQFDQLARTVANSK